MNRQSAAISSAHEERPTDVPEGWATASIGELLHLINGRAFKPAEWQAEGYPIIRIQNLNNPEAAFNRHPGPLPDKFRVKPDDLLFAWSGTPGTSFGAHIWAGGEAWLNQHIFRVDFNEDLLDKRFLRLAINRNLDDYIDQAHGGVGLAHITRGKFESSKLLVPPLQEQVRIAEAVETILATLDLTRSRLAQVPTILRRFRQAVLAAACSGRLTKGWRENYPETEPASKLVDRIRNSHEISGFGHGGRAALPTEEVHALTAVDFPETWDVVPLQWLCDPGRSITYGILKPGPDQLDGVPYVRVADFPNDRIELSGIRKTTARIANDYRRSALRAGDILLSIRGTAGRVCRVPQELDGANITQDTARISVHRDLCPDYIEIYLRCPSVQTRLAKAMKGVAVRGVNIGDIRALQIALPPLAEQQEIVRRVDALFQLADAIEKRFAAATLRAEKLTQAILAKVFRGELVPTEAELARQEGRDYEPASVLLDGIRNEDAQGESSKRSETAAPARRKAKRCTSKVRDRAVVEQGGLFEHPGS